MRDVKKWQPPPASDPKKVRAWVGDILSDGRTWLQEQPFFRDLQLGRSVIDGAALVPPDNGAEGDLGVRSMFTTNRLKRIAREMTAALSDVRFPDTIWSTDNRAYQKERELLQKVARGVWYEGGAASAIRQMVQWGLLGGTGYLWPVWKRRVPSDPGSVGIYFEAFGPLDVIPFLPDERDWQQTYAVTILRRVPISRAHWLFPMYQDKILPAYGSPFRGLGRPNAPKSGEVEIAYTLVRDASINLSPEAVPMGEKGERWSYVVPYIGQEVPGEKIEEGQRVTRPARADDCRLYPHMRLITTTEGVKTPLYDGPAYDLHGLFPARFQFDPWPTQPMSTSAFRDLWDAERARQRVERNCDTKIRAQMRPMYQYDSTVMNPETASGFDPWASEGNIGIKGPVDGGKALGLLLPKEFYDITKGEESWLQYLTEQEDYYSGVGQAAALAKARATPMQEGADDLLRNSGPIVRDVTFLMEEPMKDVFEMIKFQIIEFMRFSRVVSYVGIDDTTMESVDLSPSSLIPRRMFFEPDEALSLFDEDERAYNFASSLRLNPAPGYLHGVPQMTRQLLLMQGFRAGIPIGWRTVLKKVFGLENADEQMKQFKELMAIKVEIAAGSKKEAAILGVGEASEAGSHKGTGGRPPGTGQHPSPPQAKTKASAEGPRAVITESGGR